MYSMQSYYGLLESTLSRDVSAKWWDTYKKIGHLELCINLGDTQCKFRTVWYDKVDGKWFETSGHVYSGS